MKTKHLRGRGFSVKQQLSAARFLEAGLEPVLTSVGMTERASSVLENQDEDGITTGYLIGIRLHEELPRETWDLATRLVEALKNHPKAKSVELDFSPE